MHLSNYDRVSLRFQKRWGLKYRCMRIWMAIIMWTACVLMVLLPISFVIQKIYGPAYNLKSWSSASVTPRVLSLEKSDIASTPSLPNVTEIYLWAGSLFEQGDFDKAAKLYEEWIMRRTRQHQQKQQQQQHPQQHLQTPASSLADDPDMTWCIQRLLKVHLSTGRLADAQRWADMLQQVGSLRTEPAYYLCKALREKGEFARAYYYYLLAANLPLQAASDEEANALFPARERIHEYWLRYEESILWWHVGGFTDRYAHLHRLTLSMQMLEKPGLPLDLRQCVYNDLQNSAYSLGHYVQVLQAEKSTEEEWRFSTPTFLGDHTLVRVVNYYVSDDGLYHVSKGDKVNTRLMVNGPEEYLNVDWSERFRSTLTVPEGEDSFYHPEAYVWGLEDTRVVIDSRRGDTIFTLSASEEYSRNAGTMNQVLGILDMSNKTLWIQGVIKGPRENRHEKNWVFAEGLAHVVYDWYPTIQIGSINLDELALKVHTAIPAPESFRNMRGSTNGVLYNHEWWFVTHSVIFRLQQMRKYLHYLVVLNEDLTSILRYSLPFTFEHGSDVEYCLGLKVEVANLTFGYSVRDRSTRVMTVPWGDVGQLFP